MYFNFQVSTFNSHYHGFLKIFDDIEGINLSFFDHQSIDFRSKKKVLVQLDMSKHLNYCNDGFSF